MESLLNLYLKTNLVITLLLKISLSKLLSSLKNKYCYYFIGKIAVQVEIFKNNYC